jgi:hypothetical protein
MMTDGQRELFWDDEIEQLTKSASAIFGAETVCELVEHAVARLIVGSRREEPLTASDVKSAMRTELRRLLTPH